MDMRYIHHELHSKNLTFVIYQNALAGAIALDSEAAFQSRALEVGISSADVQALKTGGINSYSRYAFVAHINQGVETKMSYLTI